MRIIDRFSSEHEIFLRQLEAIEALRDSEATADALGAAIATLAPALLAHAENEETALFPDLEPSLGGDGGPLQVLTDEHHVIHGQIDRMQRRPSRAELVAALDAFIGILRAHIAREEDVLFPAAAEIIGDERLAELDRIFERVVV